MPVTFGYTCQECGEGIVRPQKISNYQTRVHGFPYSVEDAEDAIVGVCDKCGEEYFDASELERWEREFENEQYMKPAEIRGLRHSLALSKEAVAQLIGCTRQSVYAWERPDRERAQSRMADLLLKLVARAAQEERVDVIGFLHEQAKLLGGDIELGTTEPPSRSNEWSCSTGTTRWLGSFSTNMATRHSNSSLTSSSP